MSKFDELKKAAEAAIEREDCDRFIERDDAQSVLDLLAIQAQLVEALKLFTDFPQDVLTMPADENYTFTVQGRYFSKACVALAAAGAQP